MVLEILDPVSIVDGLLAPHLLLAGTRTSVLGDIDWLTIAMIYTGEMLSEEVRA
jgi:hypothetical protein